MSFHIYLKLKILEYQYVQAKGIEPLEILENSIKSVLAEDLSLPSSSVLPEVSGQALQRRKLDSLFEAGFHTLLSLNTQKEEQAALEKTEALSQKTDKPKDSYNSVRVWSVREEGQKEKSIQLPLNAFFFLW